MCSNPCESEVTCFRPESNFRPVEHKKKHIQSRHLGSSTAAKRTGCLSISMFLLAPLAEVTP